MWRGLQAFCYVISVNFTNHFWKSMGGYGSGRKPNANCTEDYRAIDVRRWQRAGHLVPWNCFDWQWQVTGKKVASINVKVETGRIRLLYHYRRHDGDRERLDYPVQLQNTARHYGGERCWFICPIVGCGKRVALLYLGGKYFACRHCYQLAYKSQREQENDHLRRKAERIQARLNWQPSIANRSGDKPKGMHWQTFWRLQYQHGSYVLRSTE